MSEPYNFPNADGAGDLKVFHEPVQDRKIAVLVVDDDPDLLDLTATFLKKERGEFDVTTFQDARAARAHIEQERVDAVVSDYDMPGVDGLEFLSAVRSEDEELPFILFTGKGSEEIASEAISKGVTDYLQKKPGASSYSLLANRILNGVEKYKTSRRLERSQAKFSKLVTNSSDVLGIVNENGEFEYISPVCEDMLGYEQDELIGEKAFSLMPQADRKSMMEEFFAAVEDPDITPVVEHGWITKDGETIDIETRGTNMFDDELINGFVVNGRNISELKEREKRIRQQNEQLKNMQEVLLHDIKNPLQVASDSLVLYRDESEDRYLDKVDNALDRIELLIEQTVSMAKYETNAEDIERISLEDVAERAWNMVETAGAVLEIDNSRDFEAVPHHLQRVFENMFRNAIEHSDGDVRISVGTFESGMYVEDDGPGIPDDLRSDIFKLGYTTDQTNTGLGLNIVQQIVTGHEWHIAIGDGDEGGARFEITNVTFQPQVHD